MTRLLRSAALSDRSKFLYFLVVAKQADAEAAEITVPKFSRSFSSDNTLKGLRRYLATPRIANPLNRSVFVGGFDF